LRGFIEETPTLAALSRHIEAVLGAGVTGAPVDSREAATAGGGPASSGPPVPGARRGRDAAGKEAWFVPDPDRPGKYLQVTTR
jgi:hypothetical protein